MMMDFKQLISGAWGKTTTIILGLGMTLQGILADPGSQAFIAMVPWIPKATAVLGIIVVAARAFAPPPPAVVMTPTTKATLLDPHTIVLQSESPLSAETVEASRKVDDVTPS